MEPLAFVEVLGRHGELVARHPIWRWPSRIGRGYDMDIILDDPFVAAGHLEIGQAADGRFAVLDLQSRNGMYVLPSNEQRNSAEVGPEDIVRIGHTQLQIRPRSYTVPAELQIRGTATRRGPVPFVIAAAVLLAAVIWSAFVTTSQREENPVIAFSALFIILAGAVWISVWSLVSRTIGGRANFSAHGFVACAGLLALEIWNTSIEYFSFGFDARWLETAGIAGGSALFAYMLYRHLRLTSRARARALGFTAALASALVFGGVVAIKDLTETTNQASQRYSKGLKAPYFVMVAGLSPADFLAGGERLKRRVDAMVNADP